MSRRTLQLVLSIALSAVCLWFAVRGVDWQEAFNALSHAHYLTVIPIMALAVWTLYVRAQRWRLFLRPLGRPGMSTLVAATNIGFMANMVLPLRVGEVVRPVLASRREKLPLSGVLATVVLERVFDMFTVVLLLGLAAVFVPVSAQVRTWGYLVTALTVVMAGVMALIRWQEARALALTRAVLRVAPPGVRQPAEHFVGGFIQALEVLNTPASFLQAFAWSLYLWTVIAAVNIVGFFTFDLEVPWLLAGIAVTPSIAIAVSVPSAPGYIGSFQLGCKLGLAVFHVNESQAIAYSIVLHVAQFVAIVGAGVYSLWSQGMSLRDVEAVSEQGDVAA